MDVGFIGLGAMGSVMAARLVDAGHRVRVWNRSPKPTAALQARGAVRVAAPQEAFAGDAVITMLADDHSIHSVILDSGVLDTAPPNLVHIVMATISLHLAEELEGAHRRRGLAFVSAPVMGRPDVAEAGKLNILAAGDPAAIARVQPLFDAMGQKTWLVGEIPHLANVAKLAMNFLLGSAIEAMAEAAVLAERYALAPAKLIEIATSTGFAAPTYKTYGPLIADQKFEPALFKLSLGLKDIRLALAAGAAAGVPMPFGSVLHDNLVDAVSHGDGGKDWAALALVARRRAGLDGT